MRDPKTHELALRAALQVARGNRKQAAAAVTGLVMFTGCGASADGDTGGNVATDTPAVDSGSSRATDTVQALVDAMDAAFTEDAGPAQSDMSVNDDMAASEDVAVIDDVAVAEDVAVSAPDAHDPAADSQSATDASPDVSSDCITYCYQPTDKACTTSVDCAKDEVMGACAGSGDPCSWFEPPCPVTEPEVMGQCSDASICGAEAPCPDGQGPCDGWVPVQYEECEGYQPAVIVHTDAETGAILEEPWNVICVEGFCHEGNQVSEAAMECCFPTTGEQTVNWCEGYYPDFEAGCMAWGPPAPPAFDGVTLAERAQRWLS